MKVSNLVPSLPEAFPWGKRSDSSEAAGSAAGKEALPASASSVATSAAGRAILAKYDVTNISPDQFSQMIRQLYDAGSISQQDYQQLSKVRSDMDSAGLKPDQSINLLNFYRQKVQHARQQSDDSTDPAASQDQVASMQHNLDWLEKIATVQSQPEATGVSTVA
jgi:hypothetical protein